MTLPSITLCPTLPPRTQRHLRRHLSHLFSIRSCTTRWTPTTYFLTAAPSPTPLFLCALASVRTTLLTPPFADACIAANSPVDPTPYLLPPPADNAPLQAARDALWAGRLSPFAHIFWRHRAAAGGELPLKGHRVLVLGKLKPRGPAGLVAPPNHVVLDLLCAAGAEVVDELSTALTFAIVAPGLQIEGCPKLGQLVEQGVLCLGSAFLMDLLARIAADPAHYVMVEQQRKICAPKLNTETCMQYLKILPVSRNHLLLAEGVLPTDADMSVGRPGATDEVTKLTTPKHTLPNPSPSPPTDPNKEASGSRDLCASLPCSEFTERNRNKTLTDAAAVYPCAPPASPAPRRSQRKRIPSRRYRSVPASPTSQSTAPPTKRRRASHVVKIGTQKTSGTSNTHTPARKTTESNFEHKSETADLAKQVLVAVNENPTMDRLQTMAENVRRTEGKLIHTRRHHELRDVVDQASPHESSACGKTLNRLSSEVIDLCSDKESSLDDADRALPTNISTGATSVIAAYSQLEGPLTRSQKRRCISQPNSTDLVASVALLSQKLGQDPFATSEVDTSPTTPAAQSNLGPNAKIGVFVNDDNIINGKPKCSRSPAKRPRTTIPSVQASVKLRLAFGSPIGDNDRADGGESNLNASGRKGVWAKHTTSPSSLSKASLQLHIKAGHLHDDLAEGEDQLHQQVSPKRAPSSLSRLKPLSRSEADVISEVDAVSQPPSACIHQVSKAMRAKSIFSIDDGWEFMLKALGGEPSTREIEAMLRFPGTAENDESSSVVNTSQNDVSRPNSTPNALDEQSPFIDDDTRGVGEDGSIPGEQMPDERYGWGLDDDQGIPIQASGNLRTVREPTSKRRIGNVLGIPAPSAPLKLDGVVMKKFMTLHTGDEICVAYGNDTDDRICQEEVDFTDWIFAAERYVGFLAQDVSPLEANIRASASRRLCLSLSESRALIDFGSPGVLGDSHCVVLAGICVRLISSGYVAESASLILSDLLALRDAQLLSGLDSLEIVISETEVRTIPLRHRSVATIWAALIQQTARESDTGNFWSIFNRTISFRIEKIFTPTDIPGQNATLAVKDGLRGLVELVLLVSYAFAIRVGSLHNTEDDSAGETWRCSPSNWDILCKCLQSFIDSGIVNYIEDAGDVLQAFLSDVVMAIAGKVWAVDVKLLSVSSRVVSAVSAKLGEKCFCKTPSRLLDKFQSRNPLCTMDRNFSCHIQTACDSLLLMGSLFVSQEQGNMQEKGNAMKRAMLVIKNASELTTCGPSNTSLPRVVNHHVGLILSVGDRLASSNPNGEYLLCRMLTSKCPRLETVMERFASCGKEDDQCWRTTVEAIKTRCRQLLAKGKTIDIYSSWLSQSVVGAFYKMRKHMEKRSSTIAQKEIVRAQEAVFANLALLTLGALRDLTGLLYRMGTESEVSSFGNVVRYVKQCGRNVGTLVRFATDIVSQMRSSAGEGVSRSRGHLLQALLAVLGNEIKLFSLLYKIDCGSIENRGLLREAEENSTISSDGNVEALFKNILAGNPFGGDSSASLDVKRNAARGLSQLFEVEGAKKKYAYDDTDRTRLETVLLECKLDFRAGVKAGQVIGSAGEAMVQKQREQNYVRMEFWNGGFCGKWAVHLLKGSRRMLEAAMCSAVVGVGYLVEHQDDELYKACVHSVVIGIGRVNGTEEVTRGWTQVSVFLLADKRDAPENSEQDAERELPGAVLFVEGVLSSIANNWELRMAQQVLEHLEYNARGWLVHRKKFRLASQAMVLYSHLFRLETQLGGATRNAKRATWVQGRLREIQEGITRTNRQSWDADHQSARAVWTAAQRRVIDALGCVEATGRDFETRVGVVRVGQAFAEADCTAEGLWGPARVVVVRQSTGILEEERRRVARRAGEWQRVLFHAVVADGLCGKVLARERMGEVLWRFERAAAAFWEAEGEMLKVEARKVVAQVQLSSVREIVEGDVRLCGTWSRIVRMVSGE